MWYFKEQSTGTACSRTESTVISQTECVRSQRSVSFQ
ncbi:MAG TPA: hypothetical protein ENN79_10430 [Desulfobacteraceae bacterium]|nr:hypothetical protein [Desulfobacteraceae bacterium]